MKMMLQYEGIKLILKDDRRISELKVNVYWMQVQYNPNRIIITPLIECSLAYSSLLDLTGWGI